MGKRSGLTNAGSSAQESVTATLDSVSGAVESALGRGRKARKSAKKSAQKQSRKARRRADKHIGDARSVLADARSDAAFRAQALNAAAHGKPKRGKGRRLVGLLGLAGAAVVAVRARGAAASKPSGSSRPAE